MKHRDRCDVPTPFTEGSVRREDLLSLGAQLKTRRQAVPSSPSLSAFQLCPIALVSAFMTL